MGWFKNKRKELSDLLKEAVSEANERSQTIGKTIFSRQLPDHKDFGRCETRPIFADSLSAAENYIGKLCTKNGEKFTWARKESIRATVCGYEDIGEDVYTLYLNNEVYTNLYFVLYAGQSEFPPAGLYFYGDNVDWDLKREAFNKGVSVESLLLLKKMEEENRKAKEAFEQAVALKAQDIQKKYPSFSAKSELQNPIFAFLADIDFDLITAYEYCHKEELYFKKVYKESFCTKYETKDFYFNLLYQIENEERPKVDDIHKKSTDELRAEATALNITPEALIKVREMESEHIELKWKMRVVELKDFAKQAEKFQTNFPEFDLGVEWENLDFRKITRRFDLLVAYEIVHFNECYSQDVLPETPSTKANDSKTTLFCRRCGTKLSIDSIFCHKCGTEIVILEE